MPTSPSQHIGTGDNLAIRLSMAAEGEESWIPRDRAGRRRHNISSHVPEFPDRYVAIRPCKQARIVQGSEPYVETEFSREWCERSFGTWTGEPKHIETATRPVCGENWPVIPVIGRASRA